MDSIVFDTGNFEAAVVLLAKTSLANGEIDAMKAANQHAGYNLYPGTEFQCSINKIHEAIKEFEANSIRCKCAACGKSILKRAQVLEYAGAEVCESCFKQFAAREDEKKAKEA